MQFKSSYTSTCSATVEILHPLSYPYVYYHVHKNILWTLS